MVIEITFEKGIVTNELCSGGNSVEMLLGNVYKGDDGKSAYQSALDGGFKGTEQEFNISLANPLNFTVEGEI